MESTPYVLGTAKFTAKNSLNHDNMEHLKDRTGVALPNDGEEPPGDWLDALDAALCALIDLR